MARLAFRVAVPGFLVMLTAACGWSGPSLVLAGGKPNLTFVGIPSVTPANHALIGEMLLCLSGPGRAVITAVRPVHPVGTIDVIDYAVRPNPFLTGGEMLGSDYGALRTHGFTANQTVNVPCGTGDSGQGYELGLELSVPSGTNAGTTGWDIDFRIGGHTGSTTFPYGTVLCSTPNLDDKPCKRVWRQFGMHW